MAQQAFLAGNGVDKQARETPLVKAEIVLRVLQLLIFAQRFIIEGLTSGAVKG